MQVGLHKFALGLEHLGDKLPTVLSTGAVDHVHNGGIGEALGQEVAGHSVLMFPSLTCLNLSIGGIFDVFCVGNRGWLSHMHPRQGVARNAPLKC